MVGIIFLKDIYTGSYTNLKIVVFNGSNYSEINPQNPFSEYIINFKNQKIISKNISSSVNATYFDLINLIEHAHNFLFSNPYAVCLQFKKTDTDIEFRIIPTNNGKFSLPDMYNFVYGSAVYYPLKTFTFKLQNGQIRSNPLEADVCCFLLNHALQALGSKIDALYFQAGGTLYLNLSPLLKNKFLRRHLKSVISARVYKKALKLCKEDEKGFSEVVPFQRKLKALKDILDFDVTKPSTEYEALINKTRAAKLSASIVASKYFSNVKSKELVGNLFKIVDDEKFVKIKNSYFEKISHYGRRLHTYSHIPKKHYLNYLSVYDIVNSEFDVNLRKTLGIKANLISNSTKDFKEREKFIVASDGTAHEI